MVYGSRVEMYHVRAGSLNMIRSEGSPSAHRHCTSKLIDVGDDAALLPKGGRAASIFFIPPNNEL